MEENLIIGIDPGLNHTGICLLKYFNNTFEIIYGEEIITTTKDSIQQRLLIIHNKIENILKIYPSINIMGLEETFVNINNKSSLKLGMVNGVILMLAGKFNLQLQYMSATYIKKKFTGKGSANKAYMKIFVDSIIPNIEEKIGKISHHMYDAIAIAIVAIK